MNKMIDNNFSTILGQRLLKITEISEATGVSRTTLTNIYYRRAKGIQFDTLDKLCEYLECQPSDIFKHVKEGVSHENRIMGRTQH